MTDASKIIDPKPVGLASNGPSTSVVPGSPQLSQPPHTSDRSEADARIEAALKVARGYRAARLTPTRMAADPIAVCLDGYEALCKIIGLLDPAKPQKETM